jgi:hypothetical protein
VITSRRSYGTVLLGVIVIGLAACAADTEESQQPGTIDTAVVRPLPLDTAAENMVGPPEQQARGPHGIRPDGMGEARIGMTIGELRGALFPGVTIGELAPFMVDIDGMPVVHDGDTLYHVLIPAGESQSDDARIEILATTSNMLRTAEGVWPGVPLAHAASIYGAPTLSYSTNDESREYATFPALPAGIRVRVAPADESSAMAGIYDTQGEYNTTQRYRPNAVVSMVLVMPHS